VQVTPTGFDSRGVVSLTVCVALEHEGKVILGTDSFVGNEISKDSVDGPKIFRIGQIAVAYAGGMRVPQILMHTLKVPRYSEAKASLWTVSLAEQIRRILVEYGAAGRNSEDGDTSSADMLIAVKGKVYTMQEDFAIYRVQRGYAAIGIGASYALGSLYTSGENGLTDPVHRVRLALRAAGQFSPAVSDPFWAVEV